MTVTLVFQDEGVELDCLELSGRERLGEPVAFQVSARADDTVSAKSLVGKGCAIHIVTPFGERWIGGVVWSATTSMKSAREAFHTYKLTIRSALAQLELRRRCTVFQHLTVPDIVKQVLVEGGFVADDVMLKTSGTHAKREYVTQYDETDAAFVRRICEEDGLYFRQTVEDGRERFILEDASPKAKAALESALPLEDREGVETDHLRAFDVREARKRRPGKITLRGYDPMKPALALEGVATGGTQVEKDVEIYSGAVDFLTPDEGKKRATARLEAERATASIVTFRSNATPLHPGAKCTLEAAPSYRGAASPKGDWFIVQVEHVWSVEAGSHRVLVEAIPLATPYRLPVTAHRPRALGVHSALVTGPPGQEIHTDAQGRVKLRFLWDRVGPTDDKSSLWVRVMQSSMPGSMVIPRVGWEVWVMFEDGNPDRPYVLGRTYNARQPPPVSLPANRTMTLVQTASSPGAGTKNAITFDDASGRQHLTMVAGKNQSITVAHDAHVNTAKIDNHTIGGDLSRTVGAEESVSVKQAYFAEVASQTAMVGANQHIFVKGDFVTDVKSESVLIGAALLEQIGNPVSGLTNLATAAALQGVGSIPGVGPYLAGAAGLGMGAYQGYKAGGAKGAAAALGMGAVGMAAGMVPGGEALLGSVQDAAAPAPWHDDAKGGGATEAGGGAGAAAADHSAPAAAASGQRVQAVKGMMTEAIGGSYGIITPGTVGWKTTGASSFTVGGSHLTKTKSFTQNVKGASTETLGALHVKSDAKISRVVTGQMKTTIGGALSTDSGGPHHVKVKSKLTLKVGGSLKMEGGTVVFVVGSSVVAASPGGVLIQASDVKITGDSKQSSKTTHQ
jgi:type VI secretion system secreted protein VgrG